MNTLSTQNIEYKKTGGRSNFPKTASNWGHIGTITTFSHSFEYGKAFLLDTGPDAGGWSLSWIIGGLIEQSSGSIEKNGVEYRQEERRRDSWCVRHEASPKTLFWEATVISQIRQALKSANNQYLQSEQELVNRFNLSPERYERPLKQLSSEAWRASCAIGMALGRNIYCFPYMPPEYVGQYHWFGELVNLLKESGSLVLFPTTPTELTKSWFDQVVSMPR